LSASACGSGTVSSRRTVGAPVWWNRRARIGVSF
jgi:hypothetical protein